MIHEYQLWRQQRITAYQQEYSAWLNSPKTAGQSPVQPDCSYGAFLQELREQRPELDFHGRNNV